MLKLKQFVREDSLKDWHQKQTGKFPVNRAMRQTSLVTLCSLLNQAGSQPSCWVEEEDSTNYHLKEGTGEPWAGQASPIGWRADLAILEPSFSSENFGVVPPTGSREEQVSFWYLILLELEWAALKILRKSKQKRCYSNPLSSSCWISIWLTGYFWRHKISMWCINSSSTHRSCNTARATPVGFFPLLGPVTVWRVQLCYLQLYNVQNGAIVQCTK